MTTQESGLATQPLEGTPPRVTYSIDNGRRVKTVALSLAVVAAVLIYLWHSIQPVNAGVAAAAALVIYGILFFLYNLILWRFPLLNKLDGIPDLRGHWQGTLQYEGGGTGASADDGHPGLGRGRLRVAQCFAELTGHHVRDGPRRSGCDPRLLELQPRRHLTARRRSDRGGAGCIPDEADRDPVRQGRPARRDRGTALLLRVSGWS